MWPCFAVAVTAWLNWTYNTMCDAIGPAENDRAAFAERETAELLSRPMTRSSLEQLLAAVDG